jgi:sec-independent protein translocase protein TatA
MPNIGPGELAVIVLIVLVIFGPRRLPSLGRSLGSGMREFKDAITGADPRHHPPDALGAPVADARAAPKPNAEDARHPEP